MYHDLIICESTVAATKTEKYLTDRFPKTLFVTLSIDQVSIRDPPIGNTRYFERVFIERQLNEQQNVLYFAGPWTYKLVPHFFNEPENIDGIDCYISTRYLTNGGLEEQYRSLLLKILAQGEERLDRTQIGTQSIPEATLSFDLTASFPLLTTKNVFFKGITAELFWFLSGSCDAKILHDQGVKIWDDNTSREFLDSRSLRHYQVFETGPSYGFNLRHFGATYIPGKLSYAADEGFDQIKYLVNLLRKNPADRRTYISLWDPSKLHQVCLPCCHVSLKVYVDNNQLIHGMVEMRSCDVFLGLPFNIASYALLIKMLAKSTGLKAGRLVMRLDDVHIYSNHLPMVHEQLLRAPRPLPTLEVNANDGIDFDEITENHLELRDYQPQATIKAPMAV
jgi:thymidylate synthase